MPQSQQFRTTARCRQVLCDWHAFQRWARLSIWSFWSMDIDWKNHRKNSYRFLRVDSRCVFQNWSMYGLLYIPVTLLLHSWYFCWLHSVTSSFRALRSRCWSVDSVARAVKEVESSVQQMEWGVFPSVRLPSLPCGVYFGHISWRYSWNLLDMEHWKGSYGVSELELKVLLRFECMQVMWSTQSVASVGK